MSDDTDVPSFKIYEAARDNTLQAHLQDKGLNVDSRDGGDSGLTALHWASINNDVPAVKRLLDAKADVNATAEYGDYTPLLYAARHNAADVIAPLVAAGGDINKCDVDNTSCLHHAVQRRFAGDFRAAREILKQHPDVTIEEGCFSRTPLSCALNADAPEDVVFEIVGQGANVSAKGAFDESLANGIETLRAAALAHAIGVPGVTPDAIGDDAAELLRSEDGKREFEELSSKFRTKFLGYQRRRAGAGAEKQEADMDDE